MTQKTARSRYKQKIKHLKQHFSLQRLLVNRRGISPVISTMVLIAVVIVLGFSALTYANTMSDNYRANYHNQINSNIDGLKETLAFECCFYNFSSSGKVLAYFMNAGSITADVDEVYLSTASNSVPYTLNYMNGTLAPNKTMIAGEERQIVITQTLSSGTYTVKITTTRGSSFAFDFNV